MKYYVLKVDNNISKVINLKDYTQEEGKDLIINIEEIQSGIKIPDILKKRFLFDTKWIVSDLVKEVFDNYIEEVESRAIFLTNVKQRFQSVYWEMKIPKLDCVIQDKFEKFDNVKLKGEILQNKEIFIIEYNYQQYIVVRFDVSESLLRKYPLGIKFEEILIE